ncbi:unnamed protein product [Peronospora belbahrii]|uniref:Exportin-1/Importin-beta-like domain-containing protein n=1 Tax=Peronospora belbahrii TaxID=622444 RepID=A0ABN8D5F8_9STRA|nr:unnamed protein product [Peronospora belbahrii]
MVERSPRKGWHSSTPTQFLQSSLGNSLSGSMQQSPGSIPFSQSVFSQVAGRASTQAHALVLSAAMEANAMQTTLATELLIDYLAVPTDLEWTVTCCVLRVMHAVMHHSIHFQHFLLVASSSSGVSSCANTDFQRNTNSIEHPRITLPGLTFTSLDDYLLTQSRYKSLVQSDLLQFSLAEAAVEQKQLWLRLLSALCRSVKNNIKKPVVVKSGLCVLCFWVDLGLAHWPALTPDFKPLLASNVIIGILLAPTSIPVIKAQALGLLSQLLRIPEIFAEVKTASKTNLLFNRCAKMLLCEENLSEDEASSVRALQHEIVKLLLSIITSFPSEGICFVLESTNGIPSDPDGCRSVIYYLARLLHQETFEIRTCGESFDMYRLLNDHLRMELIQDAFALVGLLSRYVDLRNELGGDDCVQSFLAVVYFLSNLPHTSPRNGSIVASARAFVGMTNLHS